MCFNFKHRFYDEVIQIFCTYTEIYGLYRKYNRRLMHSFNAMCSYTSYPRLCIGKGWKKQRIEKEIKLAVEGEMYCVEK